MNKNQKYSKDIVQLQNKLAWYESFFQNASDALFIIQPDTWNVLDANEQAAYLLDVSVDDLIGSSIPQFRRIFKLLNKDNSSKVLSELSIISKTREIILEVSARFVEIDGETLIQAIARDVTEQNALSEKLVHADKLVLLGQLIAGISHDIRNPLFAVNLNIQLLKRNIPENSPDHNYIDIALQGVERIRRIVEASLDFSKPAIIEVQRTNINSIIPTLLELTASSIKKKKISVELELENNISEIDADVKQLQQVFVNLITNAADAIKDEGIIKIRTYNEIPKKKNETPYVTITICDTGVGITDDDISKIFNPFFTRKPEGTGLGLPICQKILHQHGGIIEVESKLNIGTTFYVKLPIPKK